MFAAFLQSNITVTVTVTVRRQQSCDKSSVFHAVTEGARNCLRVVVGAFLSERIYLCAIVGALLSCVLMSGHRNSMIRS